LIIFSLSVALTLLWYHEESYVNSTMGHIGPIVKTRIEKHS